MSHQIDLKKINAMRRGGHYLRDIKKQLQDFVQVGMTFAEIEAEAQRLIKAVGCKPNFAMVPGYHWATCITKNEGVCHGIPKKQIVNEGDIITIDIGLLCEGYHLDTALTFPAGKVKANINQFLEVGRQALNKAIAQARAGKSVYDISRAMQKTVEAAGYSVVYQLTGHGVGKELHEDPSIPCYAQPSDKFNFLTEGQTLAIEVMYAEGDSTLEVGEDGWVYQTKDGSLTGMFEHTVVVGKNGAEVLT
jgi:methionyl aminopeptidase